MSLRSILHKSIDKSFNLVDSTKKGIRSVSQKTAEKVAEKLAKDPIEAKKAALRKELETLEESQSTHKPRKNSAQNTAE